MQTDDESGMGTTDQLLVDFGEVQGHAYVEQSDAQPFIDLLKRGPGSDRIAIRLSPIDEADDVEGHNLWINPSASREMAGGRSREIEREMRDRQRAKEAQDRRR